LSAKFESKSKRDIVQSTPMQNSNQTSIEYHLKEDDIVYFLHLPKTAGTTFYFLLDSFFDLDSIYPYRFWNRLLKNKQKNFSKFRFFRGHFGYSLCRLLPKKPIILTVLRDPIKRTISDYDHRVRDPDPLYEKKYSKDVSILEFFNDPEKSKTFENMQTYQIGLNPDILSITKSYKPRKLHQFRYREELPYWADDYSKEEILATAKKRLSSFEYVGIAERLEESVFLLYYTFGWRPLSRPWRLNPTKKSIIGELPTKTIEQIQNCVSLDSELYKFAQKLFDNRYSQMVEELKQKYFEDSFSNLSSDEMMYKMLEKHYQHRLTESNFPLVNSIDYDFRPKMVGSGWYYREVSEETEKAFRWSGPETKSSIDFHLAQDDDLIIQFRVMRAIIPDVLKSLKFQVNDHPIEIKKLDAKSGSTLFQAFIPKSALNNKKQFSRLSFEVDRTINPHDINPRDLTDRPLGIAIDRIKIVPSKEFDKTKDRIEIAAVPLFSKKSLLRKAYGTGLRVAAKLKRL